MHYLVRFSIESYKNRLSVCSGAPGYLSGPPRVSQSGVELEKNFECDFMASEDAHGSYKPYGRVRLTFGPL